MAAQKIAATEDSARIGLIAAAMIVPAEKDRLALRTCVLDGLRSNAPREVRYQAALSLPAVGGEPNDNFAALAKLIGEPAMEEVAVQSLLKI